MSKVDLSDFAPPATRGSGRLIASRLVAHSYVWCLYLVILGLAVPRVEAIFADFGVPLPRLTTLVFRASHLLNWTSHPIVGISLVFLVILAADALMLHARSRRGEEGWALACSMLMFAAPLFLIALTIWALVLPFFTIMPRLSG